MKTCILALLSTYLLTFFTGCKESTRQDNGAISTTSTERIRTSPIDGAWELVWEDIAGNISSTGKPSQIKLFADGYFSYLMQDSAGNWKNAGAGTFELSKDGKIYKELMIYSSTPAYVGATDWQEYEMKEDTLIFRLFTKVVMADGRDATAQFSKTIEKRVRAKMLEQPLTASPLFIPKQKALLSKSTIGVRKI